MCIRDRPMTIPSISNSLDLWLAFQSELTEYAMEVFTALFPILAFFLHFQVFFLKMRKRQVVKILVGMLYSYIEMCIRDSLESAKLQVMAARHGLLPTGGSDFHGSNKPDISIGTGLSLIHILQTAQLLSQDSS